MDSFEINKIIAAVLLAALIIIGIGKFADYLFFVDKPVQSAYKVEGLEPAKTASQVTLVHRRSSFRGHLDSVETVNKLAKNGKINLITEAEVNKIVGNDKLQSIKIKNKKGEETNLITDFWFPLFGLVPKLGPIKDWGLELEKNAIKVDTLDYSTNISGVYAIGDVNT